nr:unnamed protein product [Callosobruchus analis]
MEHLIGGRFGRVIISSYSKNPYKYGHKKQFQRGICSIWVGRGFDRSRPLFKQQYFHQRRDYGMFVVRALRSVLKIRYLLIGGAVAGGGALQKRYNDWKDGLPDLKWLEDVLPDNERFQQWRGNLVQFKDNLKNNIEIDPRLRALSESKYKEFKDWFDKRLDDAIAAAEAQEGEQPAIEAAKNEMKQKSVVYARPFARTESDDDRARREAQERLNTIQDEMMQTQIKYQRELERLEKENKELRKQNLLLKQGRKPNTRKIKKNLIDMYSEVSTL